MQTRSAIPVTLVSGFLGAGKTTLLNRLLQAEHGLRMAVLVNDFGAVNIDSQLIVRQTQTTISLANGCICCTVESDLIEQLEQLLHDRHHAPQHIVIEASGVSNPAKIANTLRYPQFRQRLAIDAIVTVVDAEQYQTLSGDMAQQAMEQLDVADIIVLNKVDLVDAERLQALKARWFYPRARILQARHGDVPLQLLLGVAAHAPGLRLSRVEAGSRLLGDSSHERIFDTWHWRSERPLHLARLRQMLAALPAEVYRAKGIVQLVEQPEQRTVVHLVGSRSDLSLAGPWAGQPRVSELVMIGLHGSLQPALLQQALEACCDSAEEVEPVAC